MDKSKICVSFILLFSFLSAVFAHHELPETSLREPSSNSVTQNVLEKGNVVKNPKPTSSQNLETDKSGVSSMSSLRHSLEKGYMIPTLEQKGKSDVSEDKLVLENRKRYSNFMSLYCPPIEDDTPIVKGVGVILKGGSIEYCGWNINPISTRKSDVSKDKLVSEEGKVSNFRLSDCPPIEDGTPDVNGDGKIRDGGTIKYCGWGINSITTENQHYDNEKVSKERNPTSSYDLERKRRSDSNMHKFNQRHNYKTTSTEEIGKSTVSKDSVDADKLKLENQKWRWSIGIGGIGKGDIGNGDYISTEPMNYKDATIMRHQNMKKFSEFDPESFRESQATQNYRKEMEGTIWLCDENIICW